MDLLWIFIGAALLVLTFLDTFLAVLNYNEPGLVVHRVARAQWRVLRSITRGLPRNARPVALRQVTGIILITMIVTWLAGVILGFAFIYFGALGMGALDVQSGAPQGFWAALYLSIGQFSTVGVENLSTVNPVVDFLAVFQALSSVVLLSMIITFLLNVFGGIQALRSLAADVGLPASGIDEPLAVLYPFFPAGRATDLERYLTTTWGDLNLYGDALRQTRTTYYFQSGDDQFSAPFALGSIGGIIAALRWGLPVGASPVSTLPALLRLEESLAAARDWISAEMLQLRSAGRPDPVSPAEFADMLRTLREPAGPASDVDVWVEQFDRMCRSMARLTSPERSDALADGVDAEEAYARYVAWLGFAAMSQRFDAALGIDLDYQPLYTGATPPVFGSGGVAQSLPIAPDVPRPTGRVRAWFRRRRWLVDPGGFRLRAGLTSLAASAAAVLAVYAAGAVAGFDGTSVSALAGVLTITAMGAGTPRGRAAQGWAALLFVVPVLGMIVVAAITPRQPLAMLAALTVIAFVSVFAGRWGAVWAGYGQLAFGAYFISLLLGVDGRILVPALLAGAFAVLAAACARLIAGGTRRRQIMGPGVLGVIARVDALAAAVVDAIDTGITDRRQRRAIRHALRALAAADATLGVRADRTVERAGDTAMTRGEVRALWSRMLDLETAAAELGERAIGLETQGLMASERAVLSARLAAGAVAPPPPTPASLARTPAVASVVDAIDSLHAATRRLRELEAGTHDSRDAQDAGAPVDAEPTTSALGAPEGAEAPRRAAQVALASAVALLAGSLVSTSHQFWAAMPAYQLMQGVGGQTRSRELLRIVATVAGATAGFTMSLLLAHDPHLALIALAVCVFALGYTRSVSGLWAIVWVNAAFALVYDAWGTLDTELVGTRILETLIGAIAAAVVSALVLPLRTRSRVRKALADVASAVEAECRGGFDRRHGDAGEPTAGDTRAALQGSVAAFMRAVLPMRTDPAAFHAGGIQTLITGVWTLAAASRRFADAEPARDAAPADRGLWADIGRTTQTNVAALADAAAGRPVRHVVPPDTVAGMVGRMSGAGDRERGGDAVRVNSAALALVNATRPGSL